MKPATAIFIFAVLFSLALIAVVADEASRCHITGVVIDSRYVNGPEYFGREYDVNFAGDVRTYHGNREVGETVTLEKRLLDR